MATQRTATQETAPEAPRAEPGPEPAPHTTSLDVYRDQVGWTPVLVVTALFGTFLSVFTVRYAFSDDYSFLWMGVGKQPNPQFGKNIFDAGAIGGRPIAGALKYFFFTAAGSIDNLRFVRLIAVVGVVALALLLQWTLVRSGIDRVLAALIAVLVCTLPAFQVYTSWTVLAIAPFAAVLAGCASWCAVAAIDGPRRLRARRLVAATALFFAALLTYQPPAMFFWVFLAVALAGAIGDAGRVRRLVGAHLGVGAVGLLLALIEVKLTVLIMGKDTIGAGRSSIATDVPGKAHWFVSGPLYQSLNLFDLTPSHVTAALVVVVAGAGIVLWLRRHAERPLFSIGVAAALVPLSYLPNLVASDNWSAYRTQVALSALIAVYASLGAIALWILLRDWLRDGVSEGALRATQRVAFAAAVVVVAASAYLAADNVTSLVVDPQAIELRMLRSQVAAIPPSATRIAFVETDWHGGPTSRVYYDEFGLPSTSRIWALRASLDLIRHEQGRQPIRAIDFFPATTSSVPTDEPTVDVRSIRALR